MGKASRAKGAKAERSTVRPAPFVARPFAGFAHETDLVAMKELLPAATAVVPLATPRGTLTQVTLATLLPAGWAGLRRADGGAVIALQAGNASGDPSRDVAAVLLALADTEPGNPVPSVPQATADTPRLQDLLDPTSVDFTLHEGFDYWVAGIELDDEGRAGLEEANETVVPMVALDGVESAYWCRMGGRTYIRWLLPQDETDATDALSRLLAAGEATLGADTRLLGAFRALGLLVPVWEVPPTTDPADLAAPMTQLAARYTAALDGGPLTADERRARSGLTSRQLTIR